MKKSTKKRRTPGKRNEAGDRNYTIGSIRAAAQFTVGVRIRASELLSMSQRARLVESARLLNTVYYELADKYFNSSVKK